MDARKCLFYLIFVFFLYLITEVLLRVTMLFFGYPFFKPSEHIRSFYPLTYNFTKQTIARGDDEVSVLILGGSVVSTPWSNLEARLDTLLRKNYPGRKFAFYNVAGAGHTSLDNLLKYQLLDKQRFELVLYYEAINENRANNVPTEDFREDYSHMKWYRDIHMLQAHPEMNVTILPFVISKLAKSIQDKVTGKVYISEEKADPKYARYGADIKTAKPYKANLRQIIALAKQRGDPLVLMSYASYFPEHVKLTGEQEDMSHFAGCRYASPVTIWGDAANVKKGIGVHNAMLRQLVKEYHVPFLDMENLLPDRAELFCDVCHVSEPGAQLLARETARFIIRQGYIK